MQTTLAALEFRFLAGPDRAPFTLEANGRLKAGATMPFHGIISRGVLQDAQHRAIPADQWHLLAHRLQGAGEEMDGSFANVLEVCGVLSFGESALAAKRYVEHLCAELAPETLRVAEIWNLKEGHTSSVWLVTIASEMGVEQQFVLNVARDQVANAELRTTSEKMRRLQAADPDLPLATVQDVETVQVHTPTRSLDVVVTRNRYIPGAYEIHALPESATGALRLFAVERFITDPDQPAKITAVAGLRLDDDAVAQVHQVIHSLRQIAADQHFEADVDINDGDLVWDGLHATIVAVR